ncbi:MAG: class I SAM-dependent methyltransferase [Desulfobacterota bacterium]|nr:class I SAM-dependent methyltransferase [Thermodesulfobacteriota bacterium]
MDNTAPVMSSNHRCLCGNADWIKVFTYTAPPAGETRFACSTCGTYYREVLRCTRCGHFISVSTMDMNSLYAGAYVSSTYGDDGIRRNFDRIISLPAEKSDNAGRVRRVVDFARNFLQDGRRNRKPRILDVGSGLCVFLYLMKQAGWQCTALDPDPRMVRHARETVGVDAVCGDFMETDKFKRFDAIAFNKVLEHVADPIAMLRHSARFLRQSGFVYVEVPDGEAAVADGPEREEFFIEHLHVFSLKSLDVLASKAGFVPVQVERIREPSSKFTLCGFFIQRNTLSVKPFNRTVLWTGSSFRFL